MRSSTSFIGTPGIRLSSRSVLTAIVGAIDTGSNCCSAVGTTRKFYGVGTCLGKCNVYHFRIGSDSCDIDGVCGSSLVCYYSNDPTVLYVTHRSDTS